MGAPWPDSANGREDDGVILSEVALTDFCNAVCAEAGQQGFAGTGEYLQFSRARRRITERIREWESRKDDEEFAEAGGWRTLEILKTAYQQADPETMLRVVLEPAKLREVR